MKKNDIFYRGFEGEPEIAFEYSENNELQSFSMWIGYFDVILKSMMEYESQDKLFIKTYNMHEGWYDESPWEVNDIDEVICLFRDFNVDKIPNIIREQYSNLINEIPELLKALNIFLGQIKDANKILYISYD